MANSTIIAWQFRVERLRVENADDYENPFPVAVTHGALVFEPVTAAVY